MALCAAAGWLAALAGPLRAQAPAPAAASERPAAVTPEPGVCFRGHPLPRCRAFALVELGYAAALAGTRQAVRVPAGAGALIERDLPSYLALEVGGMRNRGPARALGATLQLGVPDLGVRVGLKARHRTWLPGGGTFDVAAGPLGTRLRGTEYDARVWAYGGTAEAALGWRDLSAVTLGADVVRAAGRTRRAVHGGARLGSYPAVVGTGMLAAGVAFLYFVLAGV